MPKSRQYSYTKKRIVISDDKHGLPYSKGLLASSIMAIGINPSQAYEIAKSIETYLFDKKLFSVTVEQLREITIKEIEKTLGDNAAKKYRQWQILGKLDKPLVILIGGTTGVGKSTIAAEIAHRLGITRIVSTDSIREVMRVILSKDLMPALFNSSFNAWKALNVPLPRAVDPLIVGFREQVATVVVGLEAVIERAIKEGVNMVIEGIHVVPGFINLKDFSNAFTVPIVITVEDEDLHRSHFYIRGIETEGFRPYEKYRANFENIRKIGEYIDSLAAENNINLIKSYNFDETVNVVLETIINEIIICDENQCYFRENS